ncbi:MAG: hypothetical protein PHO49_04400, partial [Candidatus Nanoarchaeia archaeon]|nr:hypothetical protein [Candidatus Nanoarchaeia archaeon]
MAEQTSKNNLEMSIREIEEDIIARFIQAGKINESDRGYVSNPKEFDLKRYFDGVSKLMKELKNPNRGGNWFKGYGDNIVSIEGIAKAL